MLSFLLDTDTVSFVLRGEGRAGARLVERRPAEVAISSVTLAELRFGAERRRSKRLHALIDEFVAAVAVLPFDAAAADEFGRLRSILESRGRAIGALDTMLAAHALSLDLTFVTGNTRHFARIPRLRLEDWR